MNKTKMFNMVTFLLSRIFTKKIHRLGWTVEKLKWDYADSNCRPLACEASALNRLSYSPEKRMQISFIFSTSANNC